MPDVLILVNVPDLGVFANDHVVSRHAGQLWLFNLPSEERLIR